VAITGGEKRVIVVKRINRGSSCIPLVPTQTLQPIRKVIEPRKIMSPACPNPMIVPRTLVIINGIKDAAGPALFEGSDSEKPNIRE
jgi:hypothetical protein